MLNSLKENKWLFLSGILFCLLSLFFLWSDSWYFSLVPIALLAIYGAIFYSELTFLTLFFFVPISINIEEYTQSFGLFIPTEPMLFGLMLLVILQQFKTPFISKEVMKSGLVWAVSIYLSWLFITSLTSSNPVASFKFLIAKLWFIVPVFFYGTHVFQKRKNIKTFLYLFIIGMSVAMIYTLVVHASYSFGEKEGHWVMNPLFKDHTIYGAMVAFALPLTFGLLVSAKHTPLLRVVLFGLLTLNLLALFFSYTRAAWLSIAVALVVMALIKFKVKFSVLAGLTVVGVLLVFFSWTSIQQTLARSKAEHTTEDFGEKLESMSNVTSDASNLERLNRWACALEMFSERPIFGFGPGTYAFEYARFQKPENLTIISTNFGDGGNAHSEYLGPLSETGFIGLLTFLLLVGMMFYTGIDLYNKFNLDDVEMRTLIMAMILSLTTYFFHGILNNYLDTDKAAMPIFAICAIFLALGNSKKEKLVSPGN
jgi:O-antigen ligase